jgi:nitrogen fixation protein FixH
MAGRHAGPTTSARLEESAMPIMLTRPELKQGDGRSLTGRKVFLIFLAFFAVVIAVNVFMAHAAISTFRGVDRPNAYKAGLAFSRDIDAAEAQEERHWQVDANLGALTDGRVAVALTARDAQGQLLSGLAAHVRLDHPATARFDHEADLSPLGQGRYHGIVTATPGAWDLIVDLSRGDERVFRSRNRVIVK